MKGGDQRAYGQADRWRSRRKFSRSLALCEWVVQLVREGDDTLQLPPQPQLQPQYCFNTIITMCQRAGAAVEARAAFGRMALHHQLQPDVFTLTALLDVLGRNGHDAGSLAAYCDLRAFRVQPNVVTFVTALRVAVAHGNDRLFLRALDDLQGLASTHTQPSEAAEPSKAGEAGGASLTCVGGLEAVTAQPQVHAETRDVPQPAQVFDATLATTLTPDLAAGPEIEPGPGSEAESSFRVVGIVLAAGLAACIRALDLRLCREVLLRSHSLGVQVAQWWLGAASHELVMEACALLRVLAGLVLLVLIRSFVFSHAARWRPSLRTDGVRSVAGREASGRSAPLWPRDGQGWTLLGPSGATSHIAEDRRRAGHEGRRVQDGRHGRGHLG